MGIHQTVERGGCRPHHRCPGAAAARHWYGQAVGWLALSLLLVVAVALGTAWWIAGRAAVVHYATTPATRGTVANPVTATGTINPAPTIIIGSAVSGVIQELQCDYNTKVTQGEVCAKIAPPPPGGGRPG